MKKKIGSYSKLVNDKYLTKTYAKALGVSGLEKSYLNKSVDPVSRAWHFCCENCSRSGEVANELYQLFNTS